ncbi:pectinesterase inhibitor 7-like [Gastrolobium bilobum]|uniref:pectinesterase inhibitor 7-like n=1 Tax=Gastrolobium bilobum TaxID=150636 RepID=UPI002AB0A339|nr:pectinesterase inhibitor 7-like [Gastrolobium bilobum]
MKTHFLLSLLFLTSTFSNLRPTATAGEGYGYGDTGFIRTSCNTTLYPDVCFSSLSRYASAVQQSPAHLARVAIAVTLSKAHRIASYLSRQADYAADDSRAVSAALHDCSDNLDNAVDEIRDSLRQMRLLGAGSGSVSGSFRFGMSNVQTWMSAALTEEETCTDGFEDVPNGSLKTDVCDRVSKVKKFTSNALALVNSYANQVMP